MSADYDSPWKEALDMYFDVFMALLFPDTYAQIDWTRGYESLDKEFQQIMREGELGRRYVDKLVKVWRKDGVECWVLIHVEVQTTREVEFPERMYVYHYRIFDRYNKPEASLAVLADDDPDWRPHEYRQEVFGCESVLRFPAVKLLDLAANEAELAASTNPFAPVVLAHLKAQQTKNDPAGRHVWKLRLVRSLYERGFSAKDVRELFRVIDWIMELPPALNDTFFKDVAQIQEEKRMPFVTSIQLVGRCEGLREGIELGLKLRFGEEGLKLMSNVREVYEDERLRSILKALETASTLEEVRLLCTPTAPY